MLVAASYVSILAASLALPAAGLSRDSLVHDDGLIKLCQTACADPSVCALQQRALKLFVKQQAPDSYLSNASHRVCLAWATGTLNQVLASRERPAARLHVPP